MEARIEDFARHSNMKIEEAKKFFENPSQIKRIKEDILEKKVLDFLRQNAKIKEEAFLVQKTGEENSGDQTK